MKPYELTYIISSGIKSEEAENLKKEVEVFVQSKGGVIVKSEKTVPQSLAYPIKKHSSGYFVTLEFQGEEKEVKALKEKLEKEARVLRHFLMVKKPAKIMKERRTRKPLLKGKPDMADGSKVMEDKKKGEKVQAEEISKKLDEILSE